ncbi:GNAT family N-acetyltransferase [Vibrio rarus]|uniref:GNAT family N-acetyltransferase n=1 Tax=Vibrio rarus TaxID=413403 RepID=UPI0021C40B0F|nr:GNAT family N-acetyltransferase [Vibrio rarus]
MSDTFKVRRAIPSERATLLLLWRGLYQWHHQQCPESIKAPCQEELASEMNGYFTAPDCMLFVVERDQTLCGFISGQLYQLTSPLAKSQYIGSIDHWFIEPSYQRQGMGYALLEKLQMEFKAHGVERMDAEVWSFNKGARKSYATLGFNTHLHCMSKKIE